jgi:hypothetical protein
VGSQAAEESREVEQRGIEVEGRKLRCLFLTFAIWGLFLRMVNAEGRRGEGERE